MRFDFRPMLLLNRAPEAGLRNVKIAPTSVLVVTLSILLRSEPLRLLSSSQHREMAY